MIKVALRSTQAFHLSAVIAAALTLSGCVVGPRMSAHTPFTINEKSARFGERVRERFPVGSSEAVMVAELRREHFKIAQVTWPAASNPKGFTMQAAYNGSYWLACEIDWRVEWRADAGRISVIDAGYGDICL